MFQTRLAARAQRAALSRTAAAATALVTGVGLLITVPSQSSADTSPPAGQPSTVSADALPTVQVNGVVWAQVTVGDTVYATGSFTEARPAGVAVGGAGAVTRTNLLAYNITTGNLITMFNHSLNAQGRGIAASADGSVVYVGGEFTAVDGVAHNYLAAFATATGALISTFTPSLNNTVQALAATNSTVYVGGRFTTANGSSRLRLAAYTAAGALTTWNPGADGYVGSMTLSPDRTRLIVGGYFTTLAGVTATGMGSVSATTGASQPWAANTVIQDSGASSQIDTLSSDGSQVYGAGYFFTVGGNFEGRFAADPNTGNIIWMNNCHGDSYSVFPIGQALYSASHEHDCSDISSFSQDNLAVFSSTHHFVAAESIVPNGGVNRHPLYPGGGGIPGPRYTDFAGQPVSTQLNWFPTLTEGSYTGQYQAAWTVSGNSQYLAVGGEFPTVNGTAQQGLVRFAISSIAPNRVGPTTATSLTPLVYSLTNGTARVAWQATSDRDNVTLTYRLYRDSGTTPIYTTTLASTFWNRPNLGFLDTGLAVGSTHSYQVTVTDPFGNVTTSGSRSVTIGSSTTASYAATVLGDGASHFWPLSEASGTTAADRAGYADLALAGTITLGAAGPITGSTETAATFGGGQTTPTQTQPGPPPLPVPNNTAITTGNIPPGGAFSLEAWVKTTSTQGGAILSLGLVNVGNSAAIDKVIYMDDAGLIHFGVQNNTVRQTVDGSTAYNDGAWHLVNATFSGTTAQLYVDGTQIASSSSITDDIAFPGYWRVGGDRLAGWTAAPTSSYLAGTIGDVAVYPSALSAATVAAHYVAGTGGVVVTNQPPVASFTTSCTALVCSVDGSASTDSDGTIGSYAWTFGDGSTASGATASHTYASAGTYQITLTVTDNDGASNATSRTVTPAPTVTVYADDAFNRTVSSGFGTASPTGGAWTSTGSEARLSVTPGSAKIALPAAGMAGAYLGSVSTSNVDIVTSLSLDKLATAGNGYYFYVVARRISNSEEYLVRARVLSSTGAVRLSLSKYDGTAGTEATLASEVAAGSVTAGGLLRIRAQATGTSPTTLRAKVWADGASEPSAWTTSVTDSSAVLQTAGSVGVQGYLSGSVTNGPVTGSIAGFTASAL
jgi:PKD repeat protein